MAAIKVAGIVVHNPDKERIKECIYAILPQVDELILFLNSSTFVYGNEKIISLGDGKNKGVACALNRIMERAMRDGAEWCLLLDQDTIVPYNIVEKYEKHKELDNKQNKLDEL